MNASNSPNPKRRWYQFSLRTLFLVMTLFAIACSCYAYEMQQAAKRRAAIVEIEKIGGEITYYVIVEPPRWYSLLRKIHGDEHLGNPVSISIIHESAKDADLHHLRHLTGLRILELICPEVTDHGLEHLTDLKNLDRLYVSGTQVTDEGVKKILKDLPNCKIISRLPMVHEIPPFQGS